MLCITSVPFSILINQEPTRYIIPSRGFRQGDPLSPYLFLLCAEGLTTLLRKVEHDKQISGMAIGRGNPKLNYLLFADDIVFFYKASWEDYQNIMNLANKYRKDIFVF